MATKKQKRERLAKAEQARKEQQQAEKRARTVRAVLIGAVAVVVIIGVVFAVRWFTEDKPVVTPQHVTDQGGVVYPSANQSAAGAVEVVVYEDPLCPHCRDFEADHGPFLTEAADRGDITLEYRPIAFTGDDAVTPVNAMACVLDAAGRDPFVEFHDQLFAGEYDDSDLTDLAEESGAGGSEVADCIDEGTHEGWVDKVTSDASDAGVEATPTVWVDGDPVDLDDLDELESIVEEAGA